MSAGAALLPLLLPLLLAAGRARAQCDYQQQVGLGEYYDIKSPGYSNNYTAGTTCRWRAYAAQGNLLRLTCGVFNLPASENCRGDRVRISLTGDVNLSDAHVYCGQGTFSVLSQTNMLNMVLESVYSSRGGRFLCNITAVQGGGGGGCQCGFRKQSRIVGGTETGVNEYPMMAGLVDANTRQLYCGATIISPHYAVTAAHCVLRRDPSRVGLLVGEHDISTGQETGATRLYRVQQLIPHENYNQGTATQDNDIALVRVDGTIAMSREVMPACLPFRYRNYDFTEQPVTVLGWGTTEYGGPTSPVLRKADLYVLSPGQAEAVYGDAVSMNQICTYNQGKDACQSDSGGPLMWQDPYTGRLHLVGIVSHGIACATNNPGVNTRVTRYLSWIEQRASGDTFCRA